MIQVEVDTIDDTINDIEEKYCELLQRSHESLSMKCTKDKETGKLNFIFKLTYL